MGETSKGVFSSSRCGDITIHPLKLQGFLGLLTVLLYWIAVSLFAIVFVDISPLVALGVAGLGGFFIGIRMRPILNRTWANPRIIDGASVLYSLLHWSIISVIALNYIWFVFTDRLSLIALIFLGMLLVLRVVHARVLFTGTPHDLPVVLLVLLALFSASVLSVDRSLSLPKVYGLVFSVLVYYEVSYGIRLNKSLTRWLVVLSPLGIGMAIIGLLGSDWFSAKFVNLAEVYVLIPRVITDIPRSIRGGFHPNGVAGTLIFVIPIYAVRFVAGLQSKDGRWSRSEVLVIGLNLTAFVSAMIILALTQSRGALLALGIASITLYFACNRRWVLSLGSLIGLVLVAGVLLLRYPNLLGAIDAASAEREVLSSFQFRLTVWQVALQVFQSFSLTGVGIGTFDTVVRLLFPHLYPAFPYSSSITVTHAHNEFFQVAIDLGIPGFVAYVALWATFSRTAWCVYSWAPDQGAQNIVLGIAAGLLAHQIFGLTDAFMLGTKPGIVMWILMGIITGMYLNLAPEHLAKERAGKNNED